MPPALTPALALAYVRELSADVRAVAIAGPGGALEAGPQALADPARDLLDAAGAAAELEVATGDGVVCAVCAGERAAIAVCGRFAIPGVVRADLRAALAAIGGEPPPPATAARAAADPVAGSPETTPRAAADLIAGSPETAPHAVAERLTAAAKALIAAAERAPPA